MSLKDHPDYQEETKRLKETIDYIESALTVAETSRKELSADTHEAYVELDPLDSSLSYSRILINAKFSEMLERQYDGLLRSQKKPYFCRIDFQPEGSSKTSKLYIGKMSLEKDVDAELLIVDWRSPVASVYYDGRLGDVTYATPTGTAGGTLHKKRQYNINDGRLEDIMDVDITTTDTFLQAALGESKDNRLKDIVSTIQAEQNEIIRADIMYPLIVQGAAGSGKTTIALHRIAYLMYTYEQTFEPENFLIIAPNMLFLNYISEVLPELGAHHVKQATFAGLVYDLTGVKLKLMPTDEKLKAFIQSSADENEELFLLRQASKLKGSLYYCAVINDYVAGIEREFVPKQHLKLEGFTIYKASAIKKMFLEDYAFLPLYQRLPEIKKALALKLKSDKQIILKEIESYVDKKINDIRITKKPSEKRRLYILKLMQLRDEKIAAVKKSAKTAVNKYMSLFPKLSVTDYFKNFTARPMPLTQNEKQDADEKLAEFLQKHNEELVGKNRIEVEDLAALLSLQHKLFGFDKKPEIKYIVVDEAQDFSAFQIHVLKEVFRTELFTLLGDIAQGIHSYRGISDWSELQEVFTQRESRFLALEQSYRTTIEIMNAANEVLALSKIPGLVPAKPVVRHGEAPSVKRCVDKSAWAQELEEQLSTLKEKQYQTIAVICKTEEECLKVEKLLNKRRNVSIKRLHEEDEGYEGGVVLLPSHLAKGLEFDAVVVAVLEDDFFERELDIKLFYVAMTRALHSLDIICLGSTLRFLEKTSLEESKG